MPRVGVIEPRQSRRDRMATGETSGPIHPAPTRRSRHRYLFYVKHHGRSGDAAQWLPTLTQDQEFAVFDTADFHDLSNDRNWLYGLRNDPDGEVLEIGTDGQQIAEFPRARPNEPWHGYPLYPLNDSGPQNRQGQKQRPEPGVLKKMQDAGLLTAAQRTRLMKGKYA